MGWNEGYRLLEETVIRVYDLGKLDKLMVIALFEPYRGSDIDSGGSCDLRTKDGKSMEEVVCEAWGTPFPPRPAADDGRHPGAWRDRPGIGGRRCGPLSLVYRSFAGRADKAL